MSAAPVKEIDRARMIPLKTSPATAGDDLAIWREGDSKDLPFVVAPNRRPQNAEQSSCSEFPDADCLIVRASDKIPIGGVRSNAPDRGGMTPSLDLEDGHYGRFPGLRNM